MVKGKFEYFNGEMRMRYFAVKVFPHNVQAENRALLRRLDIYRAILWVEGAKIIDGTQKESSTGRANPPLRLPNAKIVLYEAHDKFWLPQMVNGVPIFFMDSLIMHKFNSFCLSSLHSLAFI